LIKPEIEHDDAHVDIAVQSPAAAVRLLCHGEKFTILQISKQSNLHKGNFQKKLKF